MGSLLNRGYINCCAREGEEDPPYLHFCGCPRVDLAAKTQTQLVSLVRNGYEEFYNQTGTVSQSVPPKAFRTLTYRYQDQDERYSCVCDSVIPNLIVSVDATLIREFVSDGQGGFDEIIPDNFIAVNARTFYDNDADSGIDPETGEPFCNVTTTTKQSNVTVFASAVGIGGLRGNATSGTVASTVVSSSFNFPSSFDCAGVQEFRNFTRTWTLLNEITENEAIAETPIEESGLSSGNTFSVWQIRTTQLSFQKVTSKYMLTSKDLNIGARYKVVVQLERIPAILTVGGSGEGIDANGDPAEWEDAPEAPHVYFFTATAKEMVVPGTGDINGEPTVDLPHVRGWRYRVKKRFIQLALKSE